MAIDDNTTYGLTGAQVKDLAGKINGGIIKTLTTADYDTPSGNPTSIDLKNLAPGMYKAAEDLNVYIPYGTVIPANSTLWILAKNGAQGNGAYAIYESYGSQLKFIFNNIDFGWFVTSHDIKNNLTTTTAGSPLDAVQGRVLNNKIEDRVKSGSGTPTSSTVGGAGTIYENVVDGKLYVCTGATPQGTTPETYTYTWEQISTDGFKTLTTADYDYPNATPTHVALWRLNPGIYRAGEAIEVRASTTASNQAFSMASGDTVVIIGKDGTNNRRTVIYAKSGSLYAPTVNTDGTMYSDGGTGDLMRGHVLTVEDLSNSITSPYNTRPAAQNAVRLLNEKLTGIIKTNTGAPTTSTSGTVGQLLEDTTNGKLYICTDATNPYVWEEVGVGGGGLTTLSYGNSTWNDFLTAYNAGKIVYCRASSAADPSSGSQGRMAFMAYINNPTTPTEVEFQYVRSVSSKTAAQPCDQVFVYKLTSAGGGTWTVESRNMTYKVAAGTNVTTSYSNGTVTINADAPVITMQSTDPGEGAALAANNFIAVYDAS